MVILRADSSFPHVSESWEPPASTALRVTKKESLKICDKYIKKAKEIDKIIKKNNGEKMHAKIAKVMIEFEGLYESFLETKFKDGMGNKILIKNALKWELREFKKTQMEFNEFIKENKEEFEKDTKFTIEQYMNDMMGYGSFTDAYKGFKKDLRIILSFLRYLKSLKITIQGITKGI